MNITNIFKQYVLQGKNMTIQGWKRLTLVLIITSSALVALTVYMIMSTAQSYRTDAGEMSAYSELVANPELGIARRYAENANSRSEYHFLASNPEISLHRRYAEDATQRSEYFFLVSNPEISLHRHFIESQAR